jgi:phosphoglycolate phosphatase-like HAD superfamily hydrolase
MKTNMKNVILPLSLLIGTVSITIADPLPSWNNTRSKEAIVSFVERVTKEGSKDFVALGQRIAVFDNDGTLWAEQPLYFQFLYAFDRVKELAPQLPEWKDKEPYASILKGDLKKALAGGKKSLIQVLATTHAGITTEEFDTSVRKWLATARHPTTKRPYNEMAYQPMLEVLEYLRDNDFKTFIVSGGGIDFMRVFAEQTYGIPPEQVIGSSIKAKYELRNGKPVILKIPELDFIDDKAEKPVGIHQHIGRQPIMAFGNSDGDFEMLEWTTSGKGARFGLLVHHTDADREWAYDRESHIGKLDRGLDEAKKRGWVVVDMMADWKSVFKTKP